MLLIIFIICLLFLAWLAYVDSNHALPPRKFDEQRKKTVRTKPKFNKPKFKISSTNEHEFRSFHFGSFSPVRAITIPSHKKWYNIF